MTTPAANSETRELWIQAQHEYDVAFQRAEAVHKSLLKDATGLTPDRYIEVLNKVASTLLIHFSRLREAQEKRAEKAARLERLQQAQGQPTGGNGAMQEPEACPKCGDELWDNRGNKKNPRSPDWKCKNADCGHGIWLTPPPRRAQGARR